jgi:hypothetical protein
VLAARMTLARHHRGVHRRAGGARRRGSPYHALSAPAGPGPIMPGRQAGVLRWTPQQAEAFVQAPGLVVDEEGALQRVADAGCALKRLLAPTLTGRSARLVATHMQRRPHLARLAGGGPRMGVPPAPTRPCRHRAGTRLMRGAVFRWCRKRRRGSCSGPTRPAPSPPHRAQAPSHLTHCADAAAGVAGFARWDCWSWCA